MTIATATAKLEAAQDACDAAHKKFQHAMCQVKRSRSKMNHTMLAEAQKGFDDAIKAVNAARAELEAAEVEADLAAAASEAARMAEMQPSLF